jgi:hypothetical protein
MTGQVNTLKCLQGLLNNILTASSLKAFGLMPDTDETKQLFEKLETGSSDLIFKIEHGYREHKNGKSSDLNVTRLEGLGYKFIKDIYGILF